MHTVETQTTVFGIYTMCNRVIASMQLFVKVNEACTAGIHIPVLQILVMSQIIMAYEPLDLNRFSPQGIIPSR